MTTAPRRKGPHLMGAYDREIRQCAAIGSVTIGAIVLNTEHESVAWFGLLAVAALWVVTLLVTWRTI